MHLEARLPGIERSLESDDDAQPGVANRFEWLGLAEVVQPKRLTVGRLRSALERVLRGPRYRENARRHQSDIAQIDGLRRAATIAEQALTRREAVLRS